MTHDALLFDTDGTCLAASGRLAQLASAQGVTLVGQSLCTLLEGGAAQATAVFRKTHCALKGPACDASTDVTFELGARRIRMALEPFCIDDNLAGYLAQAHPIETDDQPKLNYLIDNLALGVWDYDIAANHFSVSPAWYRLRGLDPSVDINAPGRDWLSDIHPDDRQTLHDHLYMQKQAASEFMQITYRHIHTAGHWVWIMCHAKVVETDANGLPTRIIGTDTDITDLRGTEEKLQQLSKKLRLAVDAAGIGVWQFDPNTNTVEWDDRMLKIYGLAEGQTVRDPMVWEKCLHPDDRQEIIAYAARCQKNNDDFERDYRIIRPSGETRWIRSRATQITSHDGKTTLQGVCIDLTADFERAQALEQAKVRLEHDSRHDSLTDLANRRHLDETIAAFNASARPDQTYAVLHLDLDHFKPVNDTLGHAAGDAVLVTIAKRLRSVVDTQGLVCRIGGDEFAVFLPYVPDTDVLRALCGQIILEVSKTIPYESEAIRVGVSIGCALGKGRFDDQSEVFIEADKALYAAKSAGRNCYHLAHLKGHSKEKGALADHRAP